MLIIVSACSSSIRVSTDYDKEADFSSYKTFGFYKWEQDSDKLLTRFDRERIEQSTKAELEKRGYTFTEGVGDMTVSLFVVLEQKTSRQAYTNHYGGGYGGYYDWDYGPGWGWGAGTSTTTYTETDYIDGTLIIDILDSKQRKLIWQGVGAGTVDEDAENRASKLPGEIAQIFAQFPKEVVNKEISTPQK